ncbi:MAG TPA: sigma-54 dependent transcriptional regulator [Tenuifilaceae bacterium]|jgi:DNA-binding NtrC family response regulator|nr:sigma-54 dependent transcriptional regulator [Bacteroidales bacterium]MDI9516715.1 sigma-54 dependent transcriptional regulator [Bacteroidota bacterium]OQC61011.1 MAG: Transcriptional regulatory protein ZraR [Bacteroidetes bacterium ADurb.Bin008]HOF92011.1 sigma-54 dependent transcriptional regulator [Tenuifilaceae bacterium]MZP81677.1 response regulator [Bacteroidales bacterium]
MVSLKILILDDEKVFREEIREFLENDDFTVLVAERPSEAFNILQNDSIDILILDIRLPEMDGFAVLERVKELYPQIEVIMITGHGDMDAVIQAMRMGAVEFFPKPFRLLDMKAAIKRTRRFIELNQRYKEVNRSYEAIAKDLRDNVGYEIVGNSKKIRQVMELMHKVAQSDQTSVLITGESGTGKELVARGIHYLSSRKKNFFHAVNCSAIPDSLFESEFFGHRKGAFTGANEDKAGWFEIANGGTLFLDEIVDMQPTMQSKLLRVLEDRKVRRIGATTDLSVDVRIIAATNQDIQSLLDDNKFRNDLYYRLNSFEIVIPPLREHPEDIPVLLEYYTDLLSRKMNKKITAIDESVVRILQDYNFPGNIRELRNMVERAIILSDGNRLTSREFAISGISPDAEMVAAKEYEQIFDLEELEKLTIIRAMEQTGYKKTEAAQLLNITRQSLDRRIEKHGLKL